MKLQSRSCGPAMRPAMRAALYALPAIGLAIAFLVVSSAARAQGATPPAPAPSTSAAPPVTDKAPPAAHEGAMAATQEEEEADWDYEPPLQVGDATQDLFAWQRSGVIASPTPRPIPGAIAYRSYERYLKSFEYPIPEQLNSSVKTKPSTR